MMNSQVLLGRGRELIPVPWSQFQQHMAAAPDHHRARLGFMSDAHHQVRYFVVAELLRGGVPVGPAAIAERLEMPRARVEAILADLEHNLFFLVRDEAGSVRWAFPVTAEPTPHRVHFRSGEAIYAAWAEDAIAVPFVEGRIRNESMSARISTQCAHCGLPLRISVDSALNCGVEEGGAEPLVFQPDVDFTRLNEPSIIHAYWRNSVFFWSEEHARDYRANQEQVDGVYLTLGQSAYATRIVQSALFAFSWFGRS